MPSGLRPALRGLWSTRRWPDAGWDKVGRFSEPVREARSDCERQKKGEIWNTFCSADYTQQAPSHTDRQMLTRLAAGVAALLKAKTKYFTGDFKQRAQYTLSCLLLKKNKLESFIILILLKRRQGAVLSDLVDVLSVTVFQIFSIFFHSRAGRQINDMSTFIIW